MNINVAFACPAIPVPPPTRGRRLERTPLQFQPGDTLTFTRDDGWSNILTVLGYRDDGAADILYHNGLSHHVVLTLEKLDGLRVTDIEWMGLETLNMYRRSFGLAEILDEPPQNAPHFAGSGEYRFLPLFGWTLFKCRWLAAYGLFELALPFSCTRITGISEKQFEANVVELVLRARG